MIRTDLAEEAAALAGAAGELPGVEQRERTVEGCQVTEVCITTPSAARRVGKPQGRYVTVRLPRGNGPEREQPGAEALAAELSALLEGQPACEDDKRCILVAGLGNRDITPDAVGPWAVERVLVTRHLQGSLPDCFHPVAAVATGVLGTTGVETGELLRGIVEKIRPSLVVAVDALAARAADRLCTSVQLADTGIVPGSGVGNARRALNRETLGVPVIAIGVPTVVDAATLAEDLTGQEAKGLPERLIVTPRDIDRQAREAAQIIGMGINLALHGLSYADAQQLTG